MSKYQTTKIKIVNNLKTNKAHGHDMFSIQILKLCSPCLCKSPWSIFNSCLGKISYGMGKSLSGSDPRKMINSALKTADMSFCCRSAVRSLKDIFIKINCTRFLMKMIYYHPTSHVSEPVTLA